MRKFGPFRSLMKTNLVEYFPSFICCLDQSNKFTDRKMLQTIREGSLEDGEAISIAKKRCKRDTREIILGCSPSSNKI